MRPLFLGLVSAMVATASARALEPILGKLVVLTFDDSSRSHIAVAAPLLKKHGFGATFFITEGFDFATNSRDYMTWDEIAQLHRDGFEIGNHTRDHKPTSAKDSKGTMAQLAAIDAKCADVHRVRTRGPAGPISRSHHPNHPSAWLAWLRPDYTLRASDRIDRSSRRLATPRVPDRFELEPGPVLRPPAGTQARIGDGTRATERERGRAGRHRPQSRSRTVPRVIR
jgi:peptidoglycan/xylan/chitin deacetylase (PgdA/CDA1 family)